MNIAEIMNRQILMNNLLSPFSVGGYSVLKKTLPVQLKQAVSRGYLFPIFIYFNYLCTIPVIFYS